MEFIKAYEIANKLIKKHCPDYSFKFDNAKKRFGCCHYSTKTISISRYLTFLNDEMHFIDTLKHEIAHALTKGHYHNHIWKAKAISLGCDGERCYDGKEIKIPKGKFVYQCPACKTKMYRHKRLRTRSACKECCIKYGNKKFSSDFEFVFLGVRK